MCKKCICLIRVSTLSQDTTPQREKVVATAIADGYANDEIEVIEKKESAIKLKKNEREGLKEMEEIINEHPTIECVYVFAIDRLSRRVSDVLSIAESLTERNINLVFLNPWKMSTMVFDERKNKMVENPFTKQMLAMLGIGAEMEMKIKMERFAAKKEKMISENLLPFGKPVFGYKRLKGGEIVEDEEKATIVRSAFFDYIENDMTLREIEKKYIEEGYFKPRKYYDGSIIKNILNNKAYIGDKSKRGTTISYPQLVPVDMFFAAQDKLAANKIGEKKNTKWVNYGKGIVRSTSSGRKMLFNSGICSYREDIAKEYINVNAVDCVILHTTQLLYVLNNIIQRSEKPIEYEKYIEENEKKIKVINGLLEEVEKREMKAFDMYIDGKVTQKIYNITMDKIKKEIEQWKDEIMKLENENHRWLMEKQGYEKTQPTTSDGFNMLDEKSKKEIIDTLIEEVAVTKVGNCEYDIFVTTKTLALQKVYEAFGESYHYKGGNGGITLTLSHIVDKGKKLLELGFNNGEVVLGGTEFERITEDITDEIEYRVKSKNWQYRKNKRG